MRQKFEMQWVLGMWLGRDTDSNEILVGTSTGVFKVRSIRRLVKDERFNAEFYQEFKSFPWNQMLMTTESHLNPLMTAATTD